MIHSKLSSRIPLIIANLEPRTLNAIAEGAEEIAQGAKERVAVDEGDLRDRIHVEVDATESQVAVVAGDEEIFYGHMVENGTTKVPPRPFLIPAYEAGRDGVLDHVAEALGDL